MHRGVVALGMLFEAGCASDSTPVTDAGGDSGTPQASSTSTTGDGAETAAASDDTGSTSTGDGVRFDLPMPIADVPGVGDVCKVGESDGVIPCVDVAPPDSFEPDVQWTWAGVNGATSSYVTPLVANFTDDNDDGEIDLCDIPDVLVVVYGGGGAGQIALLDGATGALHYTFSQSVSQWTTPAIGDIDDDGVVEVVAAQLNGPGSDSPILAFEHDGSLKWTSAANWDGQQTMNGSLALADLDADGDVEVVAGNLVLEGTDGAVAALYSDAPTATLGWRPSAAVPADLDEDGDLEVVLGHAAYHHDGTEYYRQAALSHSGFGHVADFDGDGLPEVLVTTVMGLTMLEHDGTVVYQDQRPTGDDTSHLNWVRPAAVHDFDGDGAVEFAMSSRSNYSVFEPDASVLWSQSVLDGSGIASGTAFDFLGDTVAEAMYADESNLFVFDGATGDVQLTAERGSPTIVEYPVVADVDNDGSAEIIVVSTSAAPTVQVIGDAEDRWIPARRIWNQHAYHVTNVREDGTIPQVMTPNWEALNTFRTQAQIAAGGGVCEPAG